ncbi:hypothetical protein [Nesterenkonia alkaliphila]|uniref:Type IV secretion system protein n=1 Tax=Nesterenkonia alkaliphila TaxID=1463631 RepID=A0A7K1UGX4_9MICC|nr:hypothetical protein [Nesterenkonia alkaliphila]MVT25720.1 hypothetical protein [Nesterenkonia alkaliphila]GFZ85330.1 hypothetical protein GCM10011359_13070 [Nesterenkonia alkaliphila]
MDSFVVVGIGGLIPDPFEDWGESFRALLAQSINSFAHASWEFIAGAFGDATSFTPSGDADSWWIAVMGGTVNVTGADTYTIHYPGMLNVMVLAMLPILIIFLTFQIILSLFRASTAGMIRAFASAVLAVPATYVTAGLVFMGLRATDAMALWILQAGTDETSGEDIGVAGIMRLVGFWYNPHEDEVVVDTNYELWAMAGIADEPGAILLPFLVSFGLLICCGILMLMMIFRTVAVLTLAMFTPIAIFSLSFEAAKSIFSKWISVEVALMLAKPVAAAIVQFGLTMASIGSDWVQLVAGAALIVIASAMPLLMLAFVSFMTPEGNRAMEAAGVAAAAGGGRRISGVGRGAARTATRTGGRVLRGGGRMITRSVRRR